ncbi:MAG: hypothetical protein LBL75_00415 [Rickettsiales bacterium]|jgi:hypothetical protein|nr:hypothetical protein [Rickettsiales bacterium]
MNKLLHFFGAVLLCAILPISARADSPIGGPGPAVANAGGLTGNRTTFTGNTGALNNNQWNSMMNQNPGASGAATNFGNCNALIQRCATPKCAGCTTMDLAIPIVRGCVAANQSCAQYGDDLVNTLAAQMVSTANAKIAAQNAAAAANAASVQNDQSAAMMAQMQQQMQEMQQQMQNSAAQSAAAQEQALAEQKKLLEEQAAAANAAAAQVAAQTAAQQSVVGVSADTIAREKIGNQIIEKLENAETSLKAVENAMKNAFSYAGCDKNGENCTGPKRVKAFKDKAERFFEPYETTLSETYDALMMAQALGVDMSDIYQLLNGSCNSWGKYLCERIPDTNGNKDSFYEVEKDEDSKVKAKQSHCTLIEVLADQAEVKRVWMDMESGNDGGIRVACASDVLTNAKLFRSINKSEGATDIEMLRRIIESDAPNIPINGDYTNVIGYCNLGDSGVAKLQRYINKKNLANDDICVTETTIKQNTSQTSSAPSVSIITGNQTTTSTAILGTSNPLMGPTTLEQKVGGALFSSSGTGGIQIFEGLTNTTQQELNKFRNIKLQ